MNEHTLQNQCLSDFKYFADNSYMQWKTNVLILIWEVWIYYYKNYFYIYGNFLFGKSFQVGHTPHWLFPLAATTSYCRNHLSKDWIEYSVGMIYCFIHIWETRNRCPNTLKQLSVKKWKVRFSKIKLSLVIFIWELWYIFCCNKNY